MNEHYGYASLEASQRLVDAGIVLETEAVWWKWDDQWSLERRAAWESRHGSRPCIPAPSMVEAWRELPGNLNEYELYLLKYEEETTAGYSLYSEEGIKYFTSTNPADALINLLIWVRKEKP